MLSLSPKHHNTIRTQGIILACGCHVSWEYVVVRGEVVYATGEGRLVGPKK